MAALLLTLVSRGEPRTVHRAAAACRAAPITMMPTQQPDDEALAAMFAALYASDETETYLSSGRAALVGDADSSALLREDRNAGLYPPGLSPDPTALQMVFVD